MAIRSYLFLRLGSVSLVPLRDWGAYIRILILYRTCSSDYRDIDPRYGTLADWDKLLYGVHERGMKLMYVNPSSLIPYHLSSLPLRPFFPVFAQDGPRRQPHVR